MTNEATEFVKKSKLYSGVTQDRAAREDYDKSIEALTRDLEAVKRLVENTMINTETAIRKRALRRGYVLRKTRGRDSHFVLIDSDSGGSVFNEHDRPNLDDIAAFLN
jgi:hypothetical protein